MKRLITISLQIVIPVLILTAGLTMLQAQTWTGAKFNPPRQDDKPPLTQQGDNLGGLGVLCDADTSTEGCKNWTHKARFNINMNDFSISAIGDGGLSGAVDAKPALEVESTVISNIEAARIGALTGMAIYTSNKSATQPALGAFNRGGTSAGYGLITNSPAGEVSAIISGRLTLVDIGTSAGRLQIGETIQNQLSVAAIGSTGAAPVYYGQSLVCKPDSTNKQCGFGNQGYTVMDNLGEFNPHKAQMNLNMQNNRIVALVSQYSTSSAIAVSNIGVDAGTRVINGGTSSRGVSAALYGYTPSDKKDSAGIYAYHSGVGSGLIAGSQSGWAARINGRLQVTGAVVPQVQVGAVENTLAGTPLVLAGSDLYWGNYKLCTAGAPNCGWSLATGNTDRWKQNPAVAYNMYFESYLSGSTAVSNVGIGTTSPKYVLDVNGSTRLTEADLGAVRADAVTVSGDSYLGNDLLVANDASIDSAGLTVDGTMIVSQSGISVHGVTMSECDLRKIIIACRTAGICTGVASITACP